MSLSSCLFNRIKSFILTIFNFFKRFLCLFNKRRRKASGDLVHMETVVIDNGRSDGRNAGDNIVSWNTWDDELSRKEPATIEDHIEQYRKSLAKLRTATEEAGQETDFFNDMTPEIDTSNSLKLNFRVQPKSSQKVSFEVQEDFHGPIGSPELGEIYDEEEPSTGWEADEDLSQVLKQQRMDERRKKRETVRKGELEYSRV